MNKVDFRRLIGHDECKLEIKIIDKHRLIKIFSFLILVFFIPLVYILLIKNTALGQMDIVNFILFGIAAASPTIAAVVIVLLFEKGNGFKIFFRSNFTPRLKISTAAICIMLPFAIMLITKLISCFLLKNSFSFANLTTKQLIIIAWAFIAEEIGWRGFLTKRLSTLINKAFLPLAVGLIWALWHYHFFIMGSIDVTIPLFIIGCVVDSYLYAALLKISKGNILIAMIFHMASNLFLNLFLINPNVNNGSHIPYSIYVIVSAIFAIGFFIVLKRRTLYPQLGQTE